jgi:putative aldouronate transport system substrate-binding protein
MKKYVVLPLCIIFVLLSLFSGCTTVKTDRDTKDDSVSELPVTTTVSNLQPAGVFPIVKEKITLRFLCPQSTLIVNMNTNSMTKYMEEKTNIHIEWDLSANLGETRAIILASGDYPDVFFSSGISKTDEMIYGSQGAFLPLNDLIDKYGVELKKAFQDIKHLRSTITAADGNIYSLPMVSETYHGWFGAKMWINTEWLNQLGMKQPTTTEEFYQMLIKFRDNDPNNNGIKDEIPLSAIGSTGKDYSIEPYLMSAFITDVGSLRIMQPYEEGNLDVVSNKPEFKTGLEYLHKLYKEDLVDPETFTQDTQILRTKCEKNIVGCAPALHPGGITDRTGEQYKKFDPVPPLKGPDGLQSTPAHTNSVFTGYYVITNKCKNPEAAFRWADWLFSEEALYWTILGKEGEDWVKAEPGELAINGKQAKYRVISTGGAQNNNWAQLGPSVRSFEWRLSEAAVQDIYDPAALETRLYQATKLYDGYQKEPIFNTSALYFNAEDAAELARLQAGIIAYQDESVARFIIGDLNLESDWDTFKRTLNDMGLPRLLELYQNAYDIKYKGTGLVPPSFPENR